MILLDSYLHIYSAPSYDNTLITLITLTLQPTDIQVSDSFVAAVKTIAATYVMDNAVQKVALITLIKGY